MGKFAKHSQKSGNRKGLAVSLGIVAVLLAAAVAAAAWVAVNYHMISGKLYPKDAVVLDLREEEITPAQFDKIREKLPECEIHWNIPFQGGSLADDVTEITLTTLSEEDVQLLHYAWNLKTVQADGCTDYENLALLRQNHPQAEIRYAVAFSQDSYDWDAETVTLNHVTEEDCQLLKYLPNLKTVAITAKDYPMSTVAMIQAALNKYC